MKAQHGYTILEMVVTLAVVGTIVTSSLSALSQTLPRWRVDQASRDIASALRAARAKAILDRTQVTVPFDTARGFYTLRSETAPGGAVIEGGLRLASLPGGVSFASRSDSLIDRALTPILSGLCGDMVLQHAQMRD